MRGCSMRHRFYALLLAYLVAPVNWPKVLAARAAADYRTKAVTRYRPALLLALVAGLFHLDLFYLADLTPPSGIVYL